MWISAPSNGLRDEFINKIVTINGGVDTKYPVKEIYLSTKTNPVGHGRPAKLIPMSHDKDEFDSLVSDIGGAGLKTNVLFNAIYSGGSEWSPQGRALIFEYLERLENLGIDYVTVAIPYFVELILSNFKKLQVSASVNSKISSVHAVERWIDLGVNRIIIDFFHGRSFRLLSKVVPVCKRRNVEIEVLVNDPCIIGCPYHIYHQCMFNSQSMDYGSNVDIPDFSQLYCSELRLKDPVEILKSNWYRPEDLHYFEEIGVDAIKLSGRMKSTQDNIQMIEAYAKGKSSGNLYSYIDTQGLYSSEYESFADENIRPFRFELDSCDLGGFIKPFVSGTIECLNGCDGCFHCQKFSRHIKYDRALLVKHLAAISTIRKNLKKKEL